MVGLRFAVVLGLGLLGACAEEAEPPPLGVAATQESASRAELRRRVGIRIARVEGPPLPMAKLLAKSVADELNRYDVPATTEMTGVGAYVLHGRTEPNYTEADIPFIVLIRWPLLDRQGKVVGTHIQGVEG